MKTNLNKVDYCNRNHSHLVYSTVWEEPDGEFQHRMGRNVKPAQHMESC